MDNHVSRSKIDRSGRLRVVPWRTLEHHTASAFTLGGTSPLASPFVPDDWDVLFDSGEDRGYGQQKEFSIRLTNRHRVMPDIDLQAEQEPLKTEYQENPEAAQITLTATGEQRDDVRACSVDIGRAIYEAELHKGAGGPGAGACSGDLLLGALAACAQLTAQAVVENFDVDADVIVEASGDLDLRGTLGIDRDAPVGFEDIRLDVSVDGELEDDTKAALRKVTERYCVVYQTLAQPPEIETNWTFR